MDHQQARSLASAAAESPLAKEQERDLAIHLVGCTECKAFYASLGESRRSLSGLDDIVPSPATVARAIHRASTVLAGRADPGPLAPGTPNEATSAIPAEPSPDGPAGGIVEPPAPTSVATPATEEPVEQAPAVDDEGAPRARVPPAALEHLPEMRMPRRERRAARRDARVGRPRLLPWLLAILATLLVAAVAAALVTQRETVREVLRPRLPAPQVVRQRVDAVFEDLSSLEASYRETRLGLYRQPSGDRVVYVFTNASVTGRVVYEGPDSLRDERSTDVGGRVSKSTTVVRGREVHTLREEGADRTATLQTNLPLGPPDGEIQSRLGALEPGMGTAAHLLSASNDLRVLGKARSGERDAYRVRFSVEPTEFSRADSIEMLLDTRTYLPLSVERTIARANAGVLGPPDLLTAEAIDARFAGRDRIRTGLFELERVTVNEPVLPGEFVLTPPPGVATQPVDEHWTRIARAELPRRLSFAPLLPRPPAGFREAAFVVPSGKPDAWGPRKLFPAPDSAFQAAYTDGRATIVITERLMRTGKDRVKGSPLASGGLPVQTRDVVRSGFGFTYGISPEVAPHVFGFVGDVYVTVSGHAPQEELVRMAVAVAQDSIAPTAVPGSPPGTAVPTAAPGSPSAPGSTATP